MKVTPKTAVNDFLEADEPEAPAAPEPEEQEEELLEPLDAIAAQFPNAPSRQVIEVWKEQHGNVYAFVPDSSSLFLLRPLRRIEHKSIAREVRAFSESATGQADPDSVTDFLHEKVVTQCMLYPKVDPAFLSMSPAGLMPVIFNLVMEHSKFLSQGRALESTYRL